MFRMRSSFVFGIAAMAAIFCGWITASTAEAQTQVILDEQFDGNAVDTSVFTFSGSGNESFFGRTQLNSPQLPGAFDSPTVANGVLQLEINSFNPFSPGSLLLNEAFTILDRDDDLILSGLLADGTPFSFNLRTGDLTDPAFDFGDDFFDPDATLTVTLVSVVPEPSSLVLLGLSGLVLLGRRRKACR